MCSFGNSLQAERPSIFTDLPQSLLLRDILEWGCLVLVQATALKKGACYKWSDERPCSRLELEERQHMVRAENILTRGWMLLLSGKRVMYVSVSLFMWTFGSVPLPLSTLAMVRISCHHQFRVISCWALADFMHEILCQVFNWGANSISCLCLTESEG